MTHLNLSVDEALSTTRAVRRRLDLNRRVEPALIEECIALSQQAPKGGNHEDVQFVAVTDSERKFRLAEVYRKAHSDFLGDDDVRRHYSERMGPSVEYLHVHFHEVPVLLVPCRLLSRPRAEFTPANWAVHYADAHLAAWSFMLAARERGLGTCLTTIHLMHEQEAADVLDLDYEQVAQTALIPVAYTLGTDFQPVPRKPVSDVLHWNHW